MPNITIETLKPFLKPEANIDEIAKLLPGTNPLDDLKDADKDKAKGLALFEAHPVLKSIRDSFVGAAVDAYKTKNYQNDVDKAVEAKLKEKTNPEETPAQKEIRELKERTEKLEKESAEKDKTITRQGLIQTMAGKLDEAGIGSKGFAKILDAIVGDDQAQAEAMAKELVDAVSGIVQATKDKILKGNKTTFLTGGAEPLSAGDIKQRYDDALKSGNLTEALRLAETKPAT